ncbi:hypothetical protein EVAR_470_1 [Eumeta japonica]|uniref:Uncharacterized protein n=1 Tax=Eumeta variegata TaxID=151549 RepID=A0A4C1SDI5_EUMVA|nr:hypothetical protein EVAR_470_1 [Eumeta japonica]
MKSLVEKLLLKPNDTTGSRYAQAARAERVTAQRRYQMTTDSSGGSFVESARRRSPSPGSLTLRTVVESRLHFLGR